MPNSSHLFLSTKPSTFPPQPIYVTSPEGSWPWSVTIRTHSLPTPTISPNATPRHSPKPHSYTHPCQTPLSILATPLIPPMHHHSNPLPMPRPSPTQITPSSALSQTPVRPSLLFNDFPDLHSHYSLTGRVCAGYCVLKDRCVACTRHGDPTLHNSSTWANRPSAGRYGGYWHLILRLYELTYLWYSTRETNRKCMHTVKYIL